LKIEHAYVCWKCHELWEQPEGGAKLTECPALAGVDGYTQNVCGGELVRLLFLLHKHGPAPELDAEAALEVERIYGRTP
jgi:hypothetical protein